LSLAPHRSAFAFFLWLSLAIVLGPALDPVGSPLREVSGSAFNAFTSEVSLGPSRAAPPERDRKYQATPAGGSERVAANDGAILPLVRIEIALPRLAVGAPFPLRSGAGPGRLSGPPLPARAPPFSFLP
jgi:hypothetical protein